MDEARQSALDTRDWVPLALAAAETVLGSNGLVGLGTGTFSSVMLSEEEIPPDPVVVVFGMEESVRSARDTTEESNDLTPLLSVE